MSVDDTVPIKPSTCMPSIISTCMVAFTSGYHYWHPVPSSEVLNGGKINKTIIRWYAQAHITRMKKKISPTSSSTMGRYTIRFFQANRIPPNQTKELDLDVLFTRQFWTNWQPVIDLVIKCTKRLYVIKFMDQIPNDTYSLLYDTIIK